VSAKLSFFAELKRRNVYKVGATYAGPHQGGRESKGADLEFLEESLENRAWPL
jgi:hypothetical protein